MRRAARPCLLACIIAGIVTLPVAAAAPMSIVYDLDEPAGVILLGTDRQEGLYPGRGGFRQEPSAGHLFDHPDDRPYRLAKESGAALSAMDADAIARALRNAIDAGCVTAADGVWRDFGCDSHLVAIDEITPRFAGRGSDALRQAMRTLDGIRSPWGGTYASRVHAYLAPAVHTAIAAGRGPRRTLGRDGRPHFPDYTTLMRALAAGGGVWLEMYHGNAGSPAQTPLTRAEWRAIPGRFDGFFRQGGGRTRQVHFLLTHARAGSYGCTDPMACTWRLAESTPTGRTILANGPGAYRVADQAEAWLAAYNHRFPPG